MTVRTSQGSYSIDFLSPSEAISQVPESAFVFTDANVWAAVEPYRATLDPSRCLVLAPGEGSKSLDAYERCLRWLATRGATRRSPVVALGGGVIGDLAGFVTATYMRGVPLISAAGVTSKAGLATGTSPAPSSSAARSSIGICAPEAQAKSMVDKGAAT